MVARTRAAQQLAGAWPGSARWNSGRRTGQMSAVFRRCLVAALCLTLLHLETAQAAHDTIEARAYANDACIVADEPFFLPVSKDADQSTAKFLPLLGLV